MHKQKKIIVYLIFAMYLCSCNMPKDTVITENQNIDFIKTQEQDEKNMMENKLSGEEIERRKEEYRIFGAKEYMMVNYGLISDEIDGYDIDAFVKYWQILSWDETRTEYVHTLWMDEKDNYKLTDEYIIYRMYKVNESDRKLTPDDTIVRIGGYTQIGNNPIRPVVVDVEKGVFYVDDTTPHDISEQDIGYFKDVNKDDDVGNWVLDFSDYEPDNTGSIVYEVRFELDTGEVCIYSAGGSTSDNFPDGPWYLAGCCENLLDGLE